MFAVEVLWSESSWSRSKIYSFYKRLSFIYSQRELFLPRPAYRLLKLDNDFWLGRVDGERFWKFSSKSHKIKKTSKSKKQTKNTQQQNIKTLKQAKASKQAQKPQQTPKHKKTKQKQKQQNMKFTQVSKLSFLLSALATLAPSLADDNSVSNSYLRGGRVGEEVGGSQRTLLLDPLPPFPTMMPIPTPDPLWKCQRFTQTSVLQGPNREDVQVQCAGGTVTKYDDITVYNCLYDNGSIDRNTGYSFSTTDDITEQSALTRCQMLLQIGGFTSTTMDPKVSVKTIERSVYNCWANRDETNGPIREGEYLGHVKSTLGHDLAMGRYLCHQKFSKCDEVGCRVTGGDNDKVYPADKENSDGCSDGNVSPFYHDKFEPACIIHDTHMLGAWPDTWDPFLDTDSGFHRSAVIFRDALMNICETDCTERPECDGCQTMAEGYAAAVSAPTVPVEAYLNGQAKRKRDYFYDNTVVYN